MYESIEVTRSDHASPTGLTKPLLVSAETRWSGFPLKMHRLAASGGFGPYAVRNATVLLCTGGRTRACVEAGRAKRRIVLKRDGLCLASAGYEIQGACWSGSHEILVAELCLSKVQSLIGVDERLELFNIGQQFAIEDRQLSALLTAMRTEVDGGYPAGRLYAESLALALATYLVNRYSRNAHGREARKLKLSAAQFHRLRDYVQAHLSQNLALTELATVVDLSANHLTVLLKNTVGLTPHHYVIHERIRAGMKLLAAGRVPIVEIALALGFSSQSHFTAVFRRATGLTPRQYRQGLMPF